MQPDGVVSKKNHPWTTRGGGFASLFMPMNPKHTPDAPCVSVSTTDTPVYNRDLDSPLHIGDSLSEKSALRYLVKECGWYWADAGLLKKSRFGGRVA